jgi:hypothetical protein
MFTQKIKMLTETEKQDRKNIKHKKCSVNAYYSGIYKKFFRRLTGLEGKKTDNSFGMNDKNNNNYTDDDCGSDDNTTRYSGLGYSKYSKKSTEKPKKGGFFSRMAERIKREGLVSPKNVEKTLSNNSRRDYTDDDGSDEEAFYRNKDDRKKKFYGGKSSSYNTGNFTASGDDSDDYYK